MLNNISRKYGKLYEEQQEMLETHMKRSTSKDDTDFVYQELVPVKRPRVKKVNEEEEKKPVKEVKMKKKMTKKWNIDTKSFFHFVICSLM